MKLASALLAAALLSGCYLAHERPSASAALDAGVMLVPDARDARDAPMRPVDANDAAPFCPPGMPCDCFVGGEVLWGGVVYAVSDANTVAAWGDPGRGWGDDLHVEARCGGTYTVTASVVARGSHCEMVTVQAVATIGDPRFGARARMGRWHASNACATEALTQTGGETCVSISWNATGGGAGSATLGCFAEFGPYCFGGPGCGGGEMGAGASGDWSF